MSESFQYAFRIDADKEIPCHLSEIKKGEAFGKPRLLVSMVVC